jgi:hypothetical protein
MVKDQSVYNGHTDFHLTIGPEEETSRRHYSVVLNVSDTPVEKDLGKAFRYWYPINEVASNWGYGPFFYAAKVMGSPIFGTALIHCHAGVCRSHAIAWFLLRHWGYYEKQVYMFGVDPPDSIWENTPGKENLMRLSEIMHKKPTFSLMGCLAEMKQWESH